MLESNYIGTNATGTAALGNGTNGVEIDSPATGNTIGGLTTTPGTGAGNVISGNAVENIDLVGGGDNTIEGNIIGLNAAGTATADNPGSIADGIDVVGSNGNTIGGTQTGARNIISGNVYGGAVGIWLHASASTNIIANNYIGTDVTGTQARGNDVAGILFGVFEGGADDANTITGNVISGNIGDGIGSSGSPANNVIQGNFIGTNAAGTAALPNTGNGITLSNGSANNTIGGTTTGAGNVISGNTGYGIQVDGSSTTDNVLEGNYVGTQVGGSGTLLNTSGALEMTNGAAAEVSGSFTGNVLNQGSVSDVANSPNTLAITGTYTQSERRHTECECRRDDSGHRIRQAHGHWYGNHRRHAQRRRH